MSKIDKISPLTDTIGQKTHVPKTHVEKADNITDELKKISRGKLKLSEKQTSYLGLIGITFSASVIFLGEKLGLQKLGPLAQIIGGIALLAGSLGLLLCGETYGKKAEKKLAMMLKTKKHQQEVIAQKGNVKRADYLKNTPNDIKNVLNEDYKNIGLHITHN